MPGIEARAPERTDTRSGRAGIAQPAAGRRLEALEPGLHLLPEAGRILLAARVVGRPRVGSDGEARRHGDAEIRHLGELAPLSPEAGPEGARSLGLAVGEEVDVLRRARRGLLRFPLRGLLSSGKRHSTTPWPLSRGWQRRTPARHRPGVFEIVSAAHPNVNRLIFHHADLRSFGSDGRFELARGFLLVPRDGRPQRAPRDGCPSRAAPRRSGDRAWRGARRPRRGA